MADPVADALQGLRNLIVEVGRDVLGDGGLIETTKWGQAAFHPLAPRTGTTVRIDALPAEPGKVALFVNCKTSLVERSRALYPDDFEYRGNRALVMDSALPLPVAALEHCIGMALTYHRKA